jgi:hypothetical protein
MRYWKVIPVMEGDDVDAAVTAYAATAHDAAIAHLKYLCERAGPVDEIDLMVWPEAGGPARTFRAQSKQVMTFAAEEMEAADA